MYNSIHIQNFRGFRDLKIDDLRRVNLIAGKNNVGKTSLLDAIAILTGNFDYYDILKLSISKMGDAAYSPRILFHEGNIEQPIQIESGRVAQLEIVTDELILRGFNISNIMVGGKLSDDGLRKEYLFQIRYETPRTDGVIGIIEQRKYLVRQHNAFHVAGGYDLFSPLVYLNANAGEPDWSVDDYSRLAQSGADQHITQMVQLLDSRIVGLNILTVERIPRLYARLKNGQQYPLSNFGEGTNRVVAIALGLSKATGGVLLIDEIDNGMHYSVMQDIWRAIGEAARQFNVQIFATTHSMECIIAAKEAFAGSDDLRVIQMARNKADDIEALTYDQEMLTAAIDVGLEVR